MMYTGRSNVNSQVYLRFYISLQRTHISFPYHQVPVRGLKARKPYDLQSLCVDVRGKIHCTLHQVRTYFNFLQGSEGSDGSEGSEVFSSDSPSAWTAGGCVSDKQHAEYGILAQCEGEDLRMNTEKRKRILGGCKTFTASDPGLMQTPWPGTGQRFCSSLSKMPWSLSVSSVVRAWQKSNDVCTLHLAVRWKERGCARQETAKRFASSKLRSICLSAKRFGLRECP